MISMSYVSEMWIFLSMQRGRGRKKKEENEEIAADDDGSASTATESSTKKKPRIRIKLTTKGEEPQKPKKKVVKRKGRSADVEDADSSIDEPVSKKQKKNEKISRKKANKNNNIEKEAVVKEDKTPKNKAKAESKPKGNRSIFLNASYWKRGRMDLDKSFAAARSLMTSQGPWTLPAEIPDDKFQDVALLTLERMIKVDKYSVFAEPVTEDEAPGYFDVVDTPMDFGTMLKKIKSDGYGSGSKAAAKLYKDFLLVFDNCLTYNEEDGEIAEEASRILGYVPEAYVNACLTILGEAS